MGLSLLDFLPLNVGVPVMSLDSWGIAPDSPQVFATCAINDFGYKRDWFIRMVAIIVGIDSFSKYFPPFF